MMIDMMMVMKKMKLWSRIEESAHLSVMSLVTKFVVVVACDHWLPGCTQRLRGGKPSSAQRKSVCRLLLKALFPSLRN